MHGNNISARFRHIRDKTGGLLHHHMNIQNLIRVIADRPDDRSSDRDVGHKCAVHNVNMDVLGPGLIDQSDVVGQMTVIRG